MEHKLKTDLHQAWKGNSPPKRILVLRFHALGDCIIAFSAIQNLKSQLPKDTKIDLIVKEEYSNIPKNLILFDNVFTLQGYSYKKQAFSILPYLIKLLINRYDVVLDLQNNTLSNYIRKLIRPKCFVEFDRFSPNHAFIRTVNTINLSNIGDVKKNTPFLFKNKDIGRHLLQSHNISEKDKLIILNPAAAFENRNWPIVNYVQLAKLLIEDGDNSIRFLVMGTDKISEKAGILEKELGVNLINLVNRTTQIEALALVNEADLVITEDGGLMHMSYLSNIKTIAILGSTRSDWVNPKMAHTYFFTSDDLECGNCMLNVCKYGTNHCVTRVSPDIVFEKAKQFLK